MHSPTENSPQGTTQEPDFFDKHPKVELFTEVFHYLREMAIGAETAARVAIEIIREEGKLPTNPRTGQFQKVYSDEDFLALFPEKAGASATGLCREATETIGMSKSLFWSLMRTHADAGTIEKANSGLWRRTK
jgi:predicted glycoside hydrolase/deacetylase ChbG (UPF0249 family)